MRKVYVVEDKSITMVFLYRQKLLVINK